MKSFIGILCKRCNTYFRIYKDANGCYYSGRCHTCRRKVRALIHPSHGTNKRFFVGQ